MKSTSPGNGSGSKVRALTMSAVFSALGVVILSLGSLFEVFDLTFTAVASLLIALAVIELGSYWPFLIYAVTGVLSALLLPNKFPAVVYLLFAGYYPIFKELFERQHNIVVRWLLKFSLFNTSLLLIILVSTYLLHLEDTGMAYRIGVFGMGNLCFLLYDLTFSKLIILYLIKLRRMFGLSNYFKNK